jgi:hypothetical protein
MLAPVGRHIVGGFARLTLHEKGPAERERRFVVINTNDASLKDAVGLMKAAVGQIERPISGKVRAILRGCRTQLGVSYDKLESKKAKQSETVERYSLEDLH